MAADMREFIIRFGANIAALCVAILVIVVLSWLSLRSIKLVVEVWKCIIKDVVGKKLTPEKFNMAFVLLFFIYCLINSARKVVCQMLNLQPSMNPIIDDSIKLFLLMFGSLLIVSWVECVRIKNRKRGQLS